MEFAEHPDVVARLRAACDQWWSEVQPLLVNEDVTGPAINPFQALYYQQFGGSPTPQELQRMDPKRSVGGSGKWPRKKKAKADK